MTVDLAKNSKGEWIGSLSIPDAGLVDVPLSGISVEDATPSRLAPFAATAVRFRIAGLPNAPSFDGKLSEDGNGLTGTATSDKGSAPFHLKRNGEANVKAPPPSTRRNRDGNADQRGRGREGASHHDHHAEGQTVAIRDPRD